MSDSVQRAFRLLVARFKKPEGNASTTSHGDTTSASTSAQTNTSPASAALGEPAESTATSPPSSASPEEEVLSGAAVLLTSDSPSNSNSTGQASTSASQLYTSAPVNDPSDPSTSHVAEFQISDPSLSISDRGVREDGGPASDRDRPPSSNPNPNGTTLSRSIAVTMNLTVNVRHHNHHHRHHLPPVHFFGAMDNQMQAAHGQGHHQHAPIGVGFIDPVNPLLARARHRLYSVSHIYFILIVHTVLYNN